MLTKRDVEQLLADYDDDPMAALTVALRRTLDAPAADWATLLDMSGFELETLEHLRAGDLMALDALAAELNERRHLRG